MVVNEKTVSIMKLKDTLILNTDAMPMGYVPLSMLSWEDSIKLMFQDRVSVVAEYDNWEVHSPSVTIKVPAIMMLQDYVNAARGLKLSSANIKLRDDYECQYCGSDCSHNHSLLTMDHVVPRAKGGKSTWTNLVAACMPCNLKKAHYDKMKPKRAPIKPTYFALAAKAQKFPIDVPHESWIDYIGWDRSLVRIVGKRR
jgi:5-methylcytosine-specific restriction endonuclease McrA